MGCGTSKTKTTAAPENSYISGKQRMLVQKTWPYLAGDIAGIGSKVFIRIFQLYPNVKQLFPCRHKEGKELLQDQNFKGHASRFMQAVGAVVDNIDDLDRSLSPLLIGLGRQHIHYNGFIPENFDAFTESMTLTWSEELKGRFTEEVKDAWEAVFDFIMMKLKVGFAQARDERDKRVP
ncbi:hemoglobin subunit mu-like [Haliotis cracherodii]|uniref:hemoglobin subunit mu-like n=1 Tax=Haliotis cracherodii TaxID=6455 RepID=UPI0039EB4483